MKGINKNSKLYQFIIQGQEYLKKLIGKEDVTEDISELLTYYQLEEIYDDRFYADRECVYMLIETLIAVYIEAKAETRRAIKKSNRYKKDNAELEVKLKNALKELSKIKEEREMKEGDF